MAKLVFSQVMKSGSGEGSRGGKIIGHTSSGKPIYDHTNSRYRELHKLGGMQGEWGLKTERDKHDYSPDDHADAAALHRKRQKEASGKASLRHGLVAAFHEDAADTHPPGPTGRYGKREAIHKRIVR